MMLILPLLFLVGFLLSVWAPSLPSRESGSRGPERLAAASEQLRKDLQSAFASYEEETVAAIEPLATDSTLFDILSAKMGPPQEELFGILARSAPEGNSIEIYDTSGVQLAWTGKEGPPIPASLFSSHREFLMLQGPLYTYLLISEPIERNGNRCGYIVAKRLFDVSYPINNRFIANSAFASTFPRNLSHPASFDFTSDAAASPDSTILTIPLRHLDGKAAGFSFSQKPTAPMLHEEASGFWHAAEKIFLLFLLLWTFVALLLLTNRLRSSILKAVSWTLFTWLFRFALLAASIPTALTQSSLFGPKYYASMFGMGIAGSPGELMITAALLLFNAIIVFQLYSREYSLGRELQPGNFVTRRVVGPVYLAVLVVVLLLVVRGFASLIQSAVDDSSLVYNDPGSVIPSLPVATMLCSLFFMAIALLMMAGIILLHARKILAMAAPRLHGNVGRTLTLWLILAVGSILFGFLQNNPLLNQWQRLIFLLIVCLMTAGMDRFLHLRQSVMALTAGLMLASALIIVPLLNAKVREVNRSRVEMVAQEVLRPESSWLTFLTNQALDDLSGDSARRLLESEDSLAIDKMGFTEWASSILSREGNNCSVTYFDRRDSVVSDFHIGIPPHRREEHAGEIVSNARWVRREHQTGPGESETWYAGYAPIADSSGKPAGGVLVELAGKKPFTVRGESTNILQSEPDPHSGSIARPIIFSEYYHGKLTSSTDDRIAFDHPFPEVLRQSAARAGVWIEETINGKEYQTYYAPDTRIGNDGWIGMSLESLGWIWQVYTFIRYLVFFSFLLILVFLVYGLQMLVRHARPQLNVRMKLLIAFAVVSCIPVIILGYYDRRYTITQAEDAIDQSLTDKTSIVAAEVQRMLGMNVPVALRHITDEQCVGIADDVNSDFTVYFRSEEEASSKPELFTAQVLDTRLSSQAFVNLFLRKRSYYSESEVIGAFPYVVGYRPVVAENGDVIGAIAVPTLFQQSDIDQEIARRNVFLYGTYALALFIALVAGTVFAHQLSSPIRRLREAAKRISRGEMTVDLEEAGTDELGQLESTFGQMVRDLQHAQEKMKKTERELAWKEMAKQVAHEIKNPLTPMKLSVQHLRQAYRDGVKDFSSILNKVSDTILEQIEVLTRIASEFSHFARMPERNLQRCSVHAILDETRRLFQHHPHLVLLTHFEALRDTVVADHDELLRACINIVRNAIQAMEEHGEVLLRTEESNGRIAVSIRDSGPGISDTARVHLFEPTFSTKTEGTGLGLAIVKKTVDDLGGEVTVYSEAGKGTTVRMSLPLAANQV